LRGGKKRKDSAIASHITPFLFLYLSFSDFLSINVFIYLDLSTYLHVVKRDIDQKKYPSKEISIERDLHRKR